MKKLSLSFFKIFIISFPLLAEQNQTIDLERIVIRGESQRAPSILRSRPQTKLSTILPKRKTKKKQAPDRFRFQDTLNIQGGRFESWRAKNSFVLKRPHSNLGFLYTQERTSGFRQGYARKNLNTGLEYVKHSHPSRPDFYLSTNLEKRKMELPEPESSIFKNDQRRESVYSTHFKLISTQHTKENYKIFFDQQRAKQKDRLSDEFTSTLWRAGVIFTKEIWETALSLEYDKRSSDRTLLSRLFIKRSKDILDDKTTLHMGLGGYLFSNNESTLKNTGFLTFVENNKKKTGVAFSPYIRLDHQLSQTFTSFVSYTQFYETTPLVDTYFDRPEYVTPISFIQPTLNIQVKGGIRYNFTNHWKSSLIYTLNRYRNKPLLIEDNSSPNQKIKATIWNQGREIKTALKIEGQLSKHLFLENTNQYLSGHWEKPSLHFTPYQSKYFSDLRLSYKARSYNIQFITNYFGPRETYPFFTRLPSTFSMDLKCKWQYYDRVQLSANIFNLSNQHNIIIDGYSDRPIHFMLGLHLKL